MISEYIRENIYHTITGFLREYGFERAPVPLGEVCAALGIELVPLTRSMMQGFSKGFIFRLWGNTDGALQVVIKRGKVYAKIGYNDFVRPERRRFTIAEEICHFLLGHYTDRRCDKTSSTFDTEWYQHCEQQARLAAGLLLCPPNIYAARAPKSIREMSTVFAISNTCAVMCKNELDRCMRKQIMCNQ